MTAVAGNTGYWLDLAKDDPVDFANRITHAALQASLENPVELAAIIALLIQLARDVQPEEFYSIGNIYMMPCTWGLIHRNLVRCPGSDAVKVSIRAMCCDLAQRLNPKDRYDSVKFGLIDVSNDESIFRIDWRYNAVGYLDTHRAFVYMNMDRCKAVVDASKDDFEKEADYVNWRTEKLALITSARVIQRYNGWI